MTDEVNLENIDDLPINLDAVSADDNTADAQEVQIDQVEAASESEDIAEGMAYDAVSAGDDAQPSDQAAAQEDSLTDSVDDSAAVDSDAHSEGTADEDTQHADAEEAAADEAPEAAAEAEEEAEEDAGSKAVKEFSKSLRTLEGKWYVLHTYFGLEDTIFQVEVPMEEVEKHTEKGKKVVTRVRVPGYVLIRMYPDENARRIVRETEGVTGFVGPSREPAPLSRKEVVSMMAPMIASHALKEAGDKPAAAKKRTLEVSYKVGDQVTVTDGPFTSMSAVVSDVEPATQKLTVLVSIFGRDTPVELGFDQVQRLDA